MPQTCTVASAPGWLYISDSEFNTLRAINLSTGIINRIAGPGVVQTIGFVNGPVLSAQFSQPAGMAADSFGSLYVADRFRRGFFTVDPGPGPRTETRDNNRDFYTVRGQLLALEFLDSILEIGNLCFVDFDW